VEKNNRSVLYRYCSYCGQRFEDEMPWPRVCPACGKTTFLNPLPVTVVLIPVDDGILAIRRAIPPHRGMLALPGGYINLGETWQQAGAREVLEETGIILRKSEIALFDVCSASDDTLLVFGITVPRRLVDLPAFRSDAETSEWVVIDDVQQLAWALHRQAAEKFFRQRIQG
jgi:ADP-ribose pyrophosphatase YjhB (NUDIX family)